MGLIDNLWALVQVMAWQQAIIWTNADPVHWRIYAALGLDELTDWGHSKQAHTLHHGGIC